MSLAELKQDVTYAVRTMRRAPGFTAIAVLTLAAGIGVNTAMFSVVNSVLLRPLPYGNADSLLALWNRWPGTERAGLSDSELHDFRERARTADVAAFAGGTDNLTGRGEPERLVFTAVTANWLDVLGVAPTLGRTFRLEEELEANNGVVILTDGLWRRLFNASPSVLGQTMTLDNRPFTVVGVLPRGFAVPYEFDSVERSAYLRPLSLDPSAPRNSRGTHYLAAVARPRPGYTREQTASEIATIAREFISEYKNAYEPTYGAWVAPLHTEVVGDTRSALTILLAAVSLVLLVACANVANLLLARARVRAREMAVRQAVGATPARLARQVFTEALVLAGLAGGAGLLLASGLVTMVTAAVSTIPRIDETTLDVRVLIFTVAASMLTALLFGSAPALHMARADAAASLGGVRMSTSALRTGLRAALVSVQVALALVLLVGATLLLQSFARLLQVPPGIRPDHVLTLNLALPVDGYSERPAVVGFFDTILDRIRSSSGIVEAGAVAGLPLRDGRGDWDVYLEGEVPAPGGSNRPTDWQVVTPGYFETMGIRLAGGRFPSVADRADSPAVAVINETFARTFFPNIDPVGRQIRMSGDNRPWMTVIGVAGDVKQDGLDAGVEPEVYLPHAQFRPFWQDSTLRVFTVVARTTGEPTAAIAGVRRHVREMDPNLPISAVTTMEDVFVRSMAERRFHLSLLGAFAAIALLLAAAGTYGVLSYQISERTAEFGVRLALGAPGRSIVATVLKQGMMPTLAGVGIGLVVAAVLTRGMTSLLFGITPLDPMTYAVVVALLVTAALGACAGPAHRAIHVDPVIALRAE
jgi:putative ABC transport system permease protein